MHSHARRRLVAFAAPVVALALAGTGTAAVRVVHPGQSIQAAIDASRNGDTIVVEPGTYSENLTIMKSHVRLQGAGIGKTLLVPPAVPRESPCSNLADDPPRVEDIVNGICIMGNVDVPSYTLGAPVSDVTISGFDISGFSGNGVYALNAANLTLQDSSAHNTDDYGMASFVVNGVTYSGNNNYDNENPGIYIGDSPSANALVKNNRSADNAGGEEGFGILIRDSNHGVVTHNTFTGNCVGIILVDTGENVNVGVSNWSVVNNVSSANDGSCTGEEGGAPPLSGIGILLGGADHTVVANNVVTDNVPTGLSILGSGGILLEDTTEIGGSTPNYDVIQSNTLSGNVPFDIFWDGSGSHNVIQK